MTPLEQLGREVADVQESILEQQGYLAEVRSRLLSPPLRRRSRKRLLTLGALAAMMVSVCFFAFLLVWRAGDSVPLAFTVDGAPGRSGSWLSASGETPLALRFSDGSTVEIRQGASFRVQEVNPHGAHLLLERGEAWIEVQPAASSRWEIGAGPYDLTVLGTQFLIAWDPTRQMFLLSLHHGRVRLNGPALGERMVEAGETVTVWVTEQRAEVRRGLRSTADDSVAASESGPVLQDIQRATPTVEGSPDAAVGSPEPVVSSGLPGSSGAPRAGEAASPGRASVLPGDPISVEPSNTAPPSEEWQGLARAGRYAEALSAAEGVGWDDLLSGAGPDDLLLLADSARLANRPAQGSEALRRTRRRWPGTEHAATAAFYLGRITFDSHRDPAAAARWFATYLQERPSGCFAREAEGRLIEARLRAGDTEGARDTALSYLERYPDGPHACLARGIISHQ
jgi:hypothetical protein